MVEQIPYRGVCVGGPLDGDVRTGFSNLLRYPIHEPRQTEGSLFEPQPLPSDAERSVKYVEYVLQPLYVAAHPSQAFYLWVFAGLPATEAIEMVLQQYVVSKNGG